MPAIPGFSDWSKVPDPKEPHVVKFCESLVKGVEPVLLKPRPRHYSQVNECFDNVHQTIEQEGGELVCGWCLCEWPGIFIEAEFHGVWKRPDGELVDVSHPYSGHSERLFLPDVSDTFDGGQRNNIRKALVTDPDLDRFIELVNLKWYIMNKGDRAKAKMVVFKPAEAQQLAEIEMETMELMLRIGRRHYGEVPHGLPGLRHRLVNQRTPRNAPCPCGSGRKFKQCCRA